MTPPKQYSRGQDKMKQIIWDWLNYVFDNEFLLGALSMTLIYATINSFVNLGNLWIYALMQFIFWFILLLE